VKWCSFSNSLSRLRAMELCDGSHGSRVDGGNVGGFLIGTLGFKKTDWIKN
jgi:hypothetical protein